MQFRPRRASALILVVSAILTSAAAAARAQDAPQASFKPQDLIPFDAAVRTGTLPNGLTYFIRRNTLPAHRVSLRLAVKAGSLDEADDQQGLAHFIEHMAFNGSAHFKPGALVSYFESVGARLGPHVNAYTSFDETVYMLDLPTDKPDVVAKGVTALADFAGGLTLDPVEVDKERGVVIEEWRGGLGASSRVRDKQIPVLYYHSRYAERLPIGKPDIIRTAPVARLRAFYDTWYRPDRMAVIAVGDIDPAQIAEAIDSAFGPITARAPAQTPPDSSVPLKHPLLVSVVTDPELTRSVVQVVRKRPSPGEQHIADYRRDLVQRMVEHMVNERFDQLSRRPDAAFLGAGMSDSPMSPDVESVSMGAAVQDGHLVDGVGVLAEEATRAREFGFSASELDRAKKWMAAFYDRAYAERDKTESGSFAEEYLQYFLVHEPSPGIAYEHRLVQQLLPGVDGAETAAAARRLLSDDNRVLLAVSPQKAGTSVPTDAELQTALVAAERTTMTAWADQAAPSTLMAKKPEPAAVVSRREIPAIGVTIVRFANGVEAWLKPTDFKNDQVIFTMDAPGGSSLAPPEHYLEASLSPSYVELSGVGGLKATDIEKLLAGKVASATPFVSLSEHGISGGAVPAEIESALQLLYLDFTAPGDDPDAFGMMTRQLQAMVANRERSPAQLFREKVAEVNSSNHYTAEPVTPERIGALDRARMIAFYRERFSNAADFTVFMVGAFKVDDVVPELARYVGSLPSTGKATSAFRSVDIHFPETSQQARVEKGTEPRSQTAIGFFADPPPDPMAQEQVAEATTVLDIALRDILREDLGQTYTVSVGLSQPLPQRGEGHIEVRFGAAPENVDAMVGRVLDEVKKLQQEGPSADLTNRAKAAARLNYETALKQNSYWLRRLDTVHALGGHPEDILTRGARIDAVTPATLQETFKRYFPLERRTVVTLVPAPAAR